LEEWLNNGQGHLFWLMVLGCFRPFKSMTVKWDFHPISLDGNSNLLAKPWPIFDGPQKSQNIIFAGNYYVPCMANTKGLNYPASFSTFKHATCKAFPAPCTFVPV
jgi:hypothetical protein